MKIYNCEFFGRDFLSNNSSKLCKRCRRIGTKSVFTERDGGPNKLIGKQDISDSTDIGNICHTEIDTSFKLYGK